MSAPAPTLRRSARLAAKAAAASPPPPSSPPLERKLPQEDAGYNQLSICVEIVDGGMTVSILTMVPPPPIKIPVERDENVVPSPLPSRWAPASEEEHKKSCNFIRTQLQETNKEEISGSERRKIYLTIFNHLLDQPILMVKNPKLRFTIQKKIEELTNELWDMKNLDIAADFAPVFQSLNTLLKELPSHPQYVA